ncbi:PucR family transcriptional regulator [Nocardia cyriacigeorgica]|nr:PucR family transcriptional regulator [Nocardia cyriacigeorgica]
MIAIDTLVESLGGAMVRLLLAGRRDTVRDVVLADSCDEIYPDSEVLVLCHGVRDEASALEVLSRSARAKATAVVLESQVAASADVLERAEALGLAVIALQPAASWTHVMWLIRAILDHSAAPDGLDARNVSSYSELFTFADAAAAIVSAPVTIEDAHSRVLAYSELQESVDRARISTIVGRRVPEPVLRHFTSRGVFRRLHTSGEPIWVDSGPDGVLPRLIIPVRAGRELLGSIWVVDPGPIPEEQLRDLTQTASVVALHLLRLRAVSGTARRVTIERLRAALITPDEESATWLPNGPWRVAALVRESDQEDLQYQLEHWELTLRRFGWARPSVTEVDGLPMTVVASEGSPRVAGTWPWLRGLSSDMRAQDATVIVVAGCAVSSAGELPRSRSEAAELRELARTGRTSPISAIEDAWHEVVIARVTSGLKRSPTLDTSPLSRLIAADRERGTEYVRTLATYLAYHGEPKRAAQQLLVHPNTLRYRMNTIADLLGVDLKDSRIRLALHLQSLSLLDGPPPSHP